jgi:hypothetical protein
LFWLLRDTKDPGKLPRAWPEKIDLYKACNRALNERLRTHQLPADPKAIDAARVLRPHGTINRKVNRRVQYWIRGDDSGRGFVYTLPELAEFLDLSAADGDLPHGTRTLSRPAQYRKVKNPGAAPLRSHGTLALNAQRAQDLLTVQTWRGGFLKRGTTYPDGHTSPGRRFMLTLYANFLRGSGQDRDSTLATLRDMAANMKPAYPSDPPDQDPPLEKLVEDEYSTTKRRRWTNKKLCALLGVSADVARELDLITIKPSDLKHEHDQARPLQADVIQARRDWLHEHIQRHGKPRSARSLARLYEAAGFTGANHETANQDLNALGYVVTRSRGGRPRKAPSVGK